MNAVVVHGRSTAFCSIVAMALGWNCLLTGPAAGQPTNADGWLWTPRGTASAPAPRVGVTAVWTGSQVLIWGGQLTGESRWLTNGHRYNVLADAWSPISIQNAPAPRYLHTAIWTGREMIIWGGHNAGSGGSACHNNGARYDPVLDNWHSVTTTGAPSPRLSHTAVWTGKEMIVWGGGNYDRVFNDGGRYDPATDKWKPLSIAGAPIARESQTAIWTGQEMIVWGGYYLTVSGSYDFKNIYPADMGRYDPATDLWITGIVPGAPEPRADCSAIWNSNEMVVWGGYNGKTYGGRTHLNSGGRFNPVQGTWSPISTNQAPTPRDLHLAVWTGEEMIVWGGIDRTKGFRDGGRYNPATDTWVGGTTNGAPSHAERGEGVWTGEAVLVYNNGLSGYYEPGTYAWDGLPNDWQRHYFGEDNEEAMAFTDPDGDGQNNQLEYVAGTVPTNALSQLEFYIRPSSSPPGRLDLNFRPWTGGRIYSLLAGTDPSASALTPIATAFTNNFEEGGGFSVTNTMAGGQYFRLRIGLP